MAKRYPLEFRNDVVAVTARRLAGVLIFDSKFP